MTAKNRFQVEPAKRYSRKAYAEFVHQVELEEIWLESLELARPRQDASDQTRVVVAIEGRTERSLVGFDGFTRLSAKFLTEVPDEVDSIDDDAQVAMKIEIVFGARYGSNITPTERFLKQFGETSVQLAHWPYLRETLQSTLMRAGWPPFTLPVFTVS